MKLLSITIVALIVGVAVGAGTCWLTYRRTIAETVIDASVGDVIHTVNMLSMARSGNYDRLIEESEMGVAVDLLGLLPAEKYLSEKQVKALLTVDRYYKKYPLFTGETNQDAVLRAFLQRISGTR